MEACGTSHYWGRKFKELGFDAQLILAQHVKQFVSSQKNDALVICEAAFRPNIHKVLISS